MTKTLNIVLAGVTGIPGRNILNAVVAARDSGHSFAITILKRGDCSPTDNLVEANKDGTSTVYVNYARPDTLKNALSFAEADIVVSALHAEPSPALDETLLKALIGVHAEKDTTSILPLFISGYTLDVMHPAAIDLATSEVIGPKIKFARLLKSEADAAHIRYCTLVTAGFMDYILPRGYTGVDLTAAKAKIFDQGKYYCTSSTLDFVAACVIEIIRGIFFQEDSNVRASLLNKRIRVAEVMYTGAQLVESAERATGKTFEVEYVNTDDRVKEGKRLISQGNHGQAVGCFFSKLVWGGTGAACFEDGMEFGQGRIKRRSLDDIMLEAVQEVKDGSKFQGVGR